MLCYLIAFQQKEYGIRPVILYLMSYYNGFFDIIPNNLQILHIQVEN